MRFGIDTDYFVVSYDYAKTKKNPTYRQLDRHPFFRDICTWRRDHFKVVIIFTQC